MALPISDPVLTFAIVMLIILIAPLVAQRLRAPGVIGLILAGILFGPNALGILDRNDTIVLLGTVGLLYIMFIAGLEINLNQFRKYRSHSLVFGCATFLVPQVLGTFLALWLLGFGWPAAILLASMFASHTLLTYPIASRLGLKRNKAVTTAVGGTIITDTAALLVLAIVARSTRGNLDIEFWLTLTASLSIYVAAVWWGLPAIGRWFFRTVPSDGTTHFVFIIACVYLCAYFAEVAGVEPIIGAFLAGLSLNRLVPEQSVLGTRLEFAGNWFFIPVFLISVGMLVDPKVLMSDITTWKVGGLMVFAVIATKFIAAAITSKVLGYSSTEGMVIFGLSVNQAAATLAAVIVGYRLEIFDETVLNGAIMMILATCLLGPWATQHFGRKLAILQREMPEDLTLAPRRILIPLRNPDAANAIMDVAFMIRDKTSHEPVYPLAVVQDVDDASARVASAEQMLGHAVMYAATADVPVVPATRLDTNASEGIIRAIRELRISTIVMGWTGGGVARNRIFGSVLDQLLKRCSQEFIVCRFSGPLSAARRLVLLVPPLSQHEIGFGDAIRTIKSLGQQAGLSLVITGHRSGLDELSAAIEKIKPDLKIHLYPVDSLDTWLDPDAPGLEDGDLFVVLAARQTQVSWHPSLDRLPRQLLSRVNPPSLLVVYPSEDTVLVGYNHTKEKSSSVLFNRIFDAERILLHSKARTPKELVDTLFDSMIELQSSDAARLREALYAAAEEEPVEIAPGLILLHIHAGSARIPLGFLATIPDGIDFARIHNPAKVVLVLVSPASLSPSAHLQHLADIAVTLKSKPGVVDQIQNSESSEEIKEIFA